MKLRWPTRREQAVAFAALVVLAASLYFVGLLWPAVVVAVVALAIMPRRHTRGESNGDMLWSIFVGDGKRKRP